MIEVCMHEGLELITITALILLLYLVESIPT
jgi:hypothetical protein